MTGKTGQTGAPFFFARAKKRGLCFWRVPAVLLLVVAVGLCGCANERKSKDTRRTVSEVFTQGELRLVALTQRNRYQNIYTSAVWSVVLDEDGTTVEDRIREEIENFFIDLLGVNWMAQEDGMRLSSQERDALKTFSLEFFSSLSGDDRVVMGVSQDEVYRLCSMYYLADKYVASLLKTEDLEVSDAEAKVIWVDRIRLESEEEAKNVLEELSGEKVDFSVTAAAYSKDAQISFMLEWREDMDALDRQAFALEQDEIGGIIALGGSYYIQKCTNAYDREATQLRKEALAQAKKDRVFKRAYSLFAAAHPVEIGEGLWEGIDFSLADGCTSDDFFDRYHEAFDG